VEVAVEGVVEEVVVAVVEAEVVLEVGEVDSRLEEEV